MTDGNSGKSESFGALKSRYPPAAAKNTANKNNMPATGNQFRFISVTMGKKRKNIYLKFFLSPA